MSFVFSPYVAASLFTSAVHKWLNPYHLLAWGWKQTTVHLLAIIVSVKKRAVISFGAPPPSMPYSYFTQFLPTWFSHLLSHPPVISHRQLPLERFTQFSPVCSSFPYSPPSLISIYISLLSTSPIANLSCRWLLPKSSLTLAPLWDHPIHLFMLLHFWDCLASEQTKNWRWDFIVLHNW